MQRSFRVEYFSRIREKNFKLNLLVSKALYCFNVFHIYVVSGVSLESMSPYPVSRYIIWLRLKIESTQCHFLSEDIIAVAVLGAP